MVENNPVWPPRRLTRTLSPADSVSHSLGTPTQSQVITTRHSSNSLITNNTPHTPLTNNTNKPRRRYRNGYEIKPPTPSYRPYALNNPGFPRQRTFAFEDVPKIAPSQPLSSEQWNKLAKDARLLPEGCDLRDFQIAAANIVITRSNDVCVIAPTGQGKSLLWTLPLLVQKKGVSLVITPYTSLGCEGEENGNTTGFNAAFVYSEQKSQELRAEIAQGNRNIVFVCPEMLECASFAQILHSNCFKGLISGIYLDEAHLVHESESWRPSLTRLRLLRDLIGHDIPLIPISATLPSHYRNSLTVFAGLKLNYELINLGNFRPELSHVVIPMEHDASSFKDLAFLLPAGSTLPDLTSQTLVYTDDLDRLTSMFWWFQARLATMGLPGHLVDLIHAGLTQSHYDKVRKDFQDGKIVFLLGSEKIAVGMNFASVKRVVQYMVRGLTIVKASQPVGRGARTKGMTAVGYFIVEPSMRGGGDNPTVNTPKDQDAGMLALIQSDDCCDVILDLYLENPGRPISTLPRCCCSKCFSSLCPARELSWIMVDPTPFTQEATIRVTKKQQAEIVARLLSWREELWRREWREQWPSFGPESLVSDGDLESIAKHVGSIHSPETIRPFTHIVYWSELSDLLFDAVCIAVSSVCGREIDVHEHASQTAEIDREAVTEVPELSAGTQGPCHENLQEATESERPRKRQRMVAEERNILPYETILDT